MAKAANSALVVADSMRGKGLGTSYDAMMDAARFQRAEDHGR